MKVVATIDGVQLARMAGAAEHLASPAFHTALTRLVGEIGSEAHAALLGPLEHQTGLHTGAIARAVQDRRAPLVYTLVTRGGNVALKYFGAREGGGGVTASPRDITRFYAGAFTMSGLPGHRRMVAKLGGQVFRNMAGGAWGGKIAKEKSGVFIPQEMVRGASLASFEQTVRRGEMRGLRLMTQML